MSELENSISLRTYHFDLSWLSMVKSISVLTITHGNIFTAKVLLFVVHWDHLEWDTRFLRRVLQSTLNVKWTMDPLRRSVIRLSIAESLARGVEQFIVDTMKVSIFARLRLSGWESAVRVSEAFDYQSPKWQEPGTAKWAWCRSLANPCHNKWLA